MERTKDGFENRRHFKGLSIGYFGNKLAPGRGYFRKDCYNQLSGWQFHRILEKVEIEVKGTQDI